MCGITGFSINKSSQFDQVNLLNRLLERIDHRGPDNKKIFLNKNKNIGLGHSRLSVIDTSNFGNQPMFDITGNYVIIYNGEVYNFEYLKKKYLNKVNFKSSSDTEVILELYKIFKSKTPSMLEGMFAFAIYDMNSDDLFIARDQMGIKPLYIYMNENEFYFSSEFKSFLEIEGFDKSIDYSNLSNHLVFLRSNNRGTIFKKVKKVEPGEFIIVKNGKIIEKKKYFILENTFQVQDISISDAKNQTYDLLKSSVKKHLRSDIPIGCMLSGGIDSSSILSLASKMSTDKIEAFTINLNRDELKAESIIDDLPYAQSMANSLGIKLNIIEFEQDIEGLLYKMIYHLDEPIADMAAINVFLITRFAKSRGFSVLLSGIGGDDIFSGYRRHEALFYESFFTFLPKDILKFISYIFTKFKFLPHRLKRLFLYSHLIKNDRLLSYYYWLNPSIVKDFLLPQINYELEVSSELEKINLKKFQFLDDLKFNKLNKMLFLEQSSYLPDHNLLYNDKMSMANGVETRVPFLDLQLVKFANSLPAHLKLNKNNSKFILKESFKKILPNNIISRKKTGFGVPLRHWLNNQLKDLAEDATSENVIKKRGIFNYDKINKLKKLNDKKKIDASYSIFSLVCNEVWSKSFLDN